MAVAQDDEKNLRIHATRGTSERPGGGDWVVVRVGDTVFGVIYGNEASPRPITLFGEYERYIGGADIYDERGDYVKTTAIPVHSVFSQSLINMVEFVDSDADGLYDYRQLEDPFLPGDVPLNFLSLAQSWELSGWDLQENDKTASLDFSLSVSNVPYAWVWDEQSQLRVDGVMRAERVGEIRITFHIDISIESVKVEDIPWYEVTVSGFPRRGYVDSRFVEYRDFDGTSVNMNFKYDHFISGWDFHSNQTSIAMGTTILAGNLVDLDVAKLVHEENQLRAIEENGTDERYEITETDLEPVKPVLIEKNRIQFYDDSYRLGRLTWVSDVEVDGETERMHFEVHGLGPATWEKNSKIFRGFQIKGAFVYPQGQTIIHDPEFTDSVQIFSIPLLSNVLPPIVMIVQVAIGAIGLGIAFIVSMKKKKSKGGE
jgi:hypothetical protein